MRCMTCQLYTYINTVHQRYATSRKALLPFCLLHAGHDRLMVIPPWPQDFGPRENGWEHPLRDDTSAGSTSQEASLK